MKAKKVLAVALAAAMAFSALPGMSVKADEIVGGTVYIEQDIIDVILPTTESQKFYIDPQGLIALGKGEAVATGEGVVTGKSEMYAVNKSSMPLALSVNYKLKDSVTTNGVTIATDASVQNATGMAIAVYVAAEQSGDYEVASGSATATGASTGLVVKAGDNALVSGTGVDLTTGMSSKDEVYASATGTSENYFMTAQSYKAQLKDGIATGDATKIYDSSSYEYVIDPTANDASCVKLTIGGYCSTKANWSAYAKGTETLKLDVTFKFKKLTQVSGSTTNYYLAANAEEAQTGPKVTMTAGGLITISDLTAAKNVTGHGDLVATKGTETAKLQAKTATFSDSLGWTAAAGGSCTFQLNADWKVWNGSSVTVTVTLTDGSTITSAPVTLNVQ